MKSPSSTRLVHAGQTPASGAGLPVNPPVVRASTVLFPSVAAQQDVKERRGRERLFSYGARGNPTSFALEDMVTELEGAHRTRLFPTGLNAIAMTWLAFLKPGDHLLISDATYEPARALAASFLAPYGIEASFFAADGHDVEAKLRPNTRMIYAECPGSLVYEMADLRHLAALARGRGIWLAADNTWGSGWLYQPLALGAHISVIAATKYLCGHSDVVMGCVSTTADAWQPLADRSDAFGVTVSADDAYLVLRGTRTLAARMRVHESSALAVARWLQARAEVAQVFCPALPADPGHALWQRDCRGQNGLVSFELRPGHTRAQAEAVADRLRLFGIGASWGGYESLVTVPDLKSARSVTDWSRHGPILRLHIGLEEPEDLLADLAQALESLSNPRLPVAD
ncbi:MAG TPA: cystathionine beta-lyase [Burkholderiaceae bacterium]|nr:cystathionine beta-lyase [Burkholderiaceae bacterium]